MWCLLSEAGFAGFKDLQESRPGGRSYRKSNCLNRGGHGGRGGRGNWGVCGVYCLKQDLQDF